MGRAAHLKIKIKMLFAAYVCIMDDRLRVSMTLPVASLKWRSCTLMYKLYCFFYWRLYSSTILVFHTPSYNLIELLLFTKRPFSLHHPRMGFHWCKWLILYLAMDYDGKYWWMILYSLIRWNKVNHSLPALYWFKDNYFKLTCLWIDQMKIIL